MISSLRPAFPYFGSKRAVAELIWDAIGDVPNWVEPFMGSCAVTLARPDEHARKVETCNDIHAFIPNFMRAVRYDPEAVAYWAASPVSEIDMHARHRRLVDEMTPELVERLREEPEFCDVKIAGWWVWGASCWIGSGWCQTGGELSRQAPHLGGGDPSRVGPQNGGMGINRPTLVSRLPHLIGPHNGRKLGAEQIPSLSGSGDGSGVGYGRGIFATGRREDLSAYFRTLAERLALVRFTCGDWARVVTPAVTISHGLTGVLLDPPYPDRDRATVYAHDDRSIAKAVGEWAREHGADPRYRIVLCGYEGNYDLPGWRVVAWKSRGGYGRGKNANATRERLWMSPHCLGGELDAGPLFARGAP